MSLQALTWALEQDLPSSEKLVLISICNYVGNESGEAWPSHSTIARIAGISDRTVRRCLIQLKSKGLIDWTQRKNGDAMTSNLYKVRTPCHRGTDTMSGGVRTQVPGGTDTMSDEPVIEPINGTSHGIGQFEEQLKKTGKAMNKAVVKLDTFVKGKREQKQDAILTAVEQFGDVHTINSVMAAVTSGDDVWPQDILRICNAHKESYERL